MSRKTDRSRGRDGADTGRRRFLRAVPALLAAAWVVRGVPGGIELPPPPRLLGLEQADLHGPHDLAG